MKLPDGLLSERDLLHDPYTRICASITPLFSEFLMDKVLNAGAAPGFPPAVKELYAYTAIGLEDSLEDYQAYVKLIPEAVQSLRKAKNYSEDTEALDRLQISVDELMSELKFYYDAMNWRKVFVQRHFTALLRAVSTVTTTGPQPHRSSIRGFLVSLAALRDEIFTSSDTSRIEEYLESSAEIRRHDSYMLRRFQVEREERRSLEPLSAIEDLEDEILVRVLLEDATRCKSGS